MQRLEDKKGQLKVDSLADRKPMELPKDGSDVVTPPFPVTSRAAAF